MMDKLIPPDEIYVPFQKAIDYDLVAVFGVITGEVKYLRATPKRAAADAMYYRLDDAIAWIETLVDESSAQYDSARLDWLKDALALADGKEVE